MVISLLAVLIVLVSSLGGYFYLKPSVYLVRLHPEGLYLNDKQPISLAGEKTDQSRRILNHLSVGRHIIYYDVTQSQRYYAELDITRGQNNIEPVFKALSLPSILARLDINEQKSLIKTEKFNYALYDKQGQLLPFNAELSVTLNSVPDVESPDIMQDNYQGALILNGKTYDIDTRAFGHRLSDENSQPIAPVLIYEDEYQAYYFKGYVYKTTFEFDMYALFK